MSYQAAKQIVLKAAAGKWGTYPYEDALAAGREALRELKQWGWGLQKSSEFTRVPFDSALSTLQAARVYPLTVKWLFTLAKVTLRKAQRNPRGRLELPGVEEHHTLVRNVYRAIKLLEQELAKEGRQ